MSLSSVLSALEQAVHAMSSAGIPSVVDLGVDGTAREEEDRDRGAAEDDDEEDVRPAAAEEDDEEEDEEDALPDAAAAAAAARMEKEDEGKPGSGEPDGSVLGLPVDDDEGVRREA